MFDLATRTALRAELALLVTKAEMKSEMTLLKTEIERDFLKIERDFHKLLTAHSLAIIGAVTAVVTMLHFWK